MPTRSKPDGRNVRDLNDRILKLSNDMITVLTQPLGSTDTVKYNAAMKEAIRMANDIGYYAGEIQIICLLAAKHGEGE